jgi:hypothetical protein
MFSWANKSLQCSVRTEKLHKISFINLENKN